MKKRKKRKFAQKVRRLIAEAERLEAFVEGALYVVLIVSKARR